MSIDWIECTCPNCGHEEPADADMIERGRALVCRECGADMVPDGEA